MSDPTESVPIVEFQSVGKNFGANAALVDINLEIHSGEVHGLVGGNGAGKSTLMKILAGAFSEYIGQVAIDGQPVALTRPQASQQNGVAMVFQELSGIGQLSVAENLFLGRQPTRWGVVDWNRMHTQATSYLRDLGLDIDVTRRLDQYPLLVRQMVEIARALHSGARILLLDEPTSALSLPETERLFALIKELRRRGLAVIFVSHFIEDVLAICDRVTILRDGQLVETRDAAELDKSYVIHRMLGHELSREEIGFDSAVRLPPLADGPARLEVHQIATAALPEPISLQVAAGECLGLYGFYGAGHQELVHAIGGATPAMGAISADGKYYPPGSTHRAIKNGAVLVVADRKASVVANAPIAHNVTLAHLQKVLPPVLVSSQEETTVSPMLRKVGCKPHDPWLTAGNLSGGNQQKVVLAKWLLNDVNVLLLDEPTRGMDVGAKEEVMEIVDGLKRQGAAVVIASCEPEFLLASCDRILVMKRGRIMHQFADEEVDKADLLRFA